MKQIFAALVGLISIPALAQDVHTADNLYYIIVLKENVNVRTCAKEICAIAKANCSGDCKIIGETLGIMSANLTTYAAEQVEKHQCVEVMEIEGSMEAKPRVGRSN